MTAMRRNLAFWLAVAAIAAATIAIAVATGTKMLDRPERPPYVDDVTPTAAKVALPHLDDEQFWDHCLDLGGAPLMLKAGEGGQLSGKPYTEQTRVGAPYRDCFDKDGNSLLPYVPPPVVVTVWPYEDGMPGEAAR